jgi:hypothetical protein
MEKLAAAALRDQSEALKLVNSFKDRLSERELKAILLAIKSAQHLSSLSAEHCSSLQETMLKVREIAMLDDEDRIYAELMVLILKQSGVKESDVKTEGNEPEDEGGYDAMSVGLSPRGPSPESGYYDAKHVEEQKEDET